jgi:DNA-binding MarR family transcriptional regulator
MAMSDRGREQPAQRASPFPDDLISSLLRRLVRSGGLLEPDGLVGGHASLSEILALRELAESPGLAQNDLAERLGLEKSTVSRLVAGMEQRGWVGRHRDQSNRRFLRLSLTHEGMDVAHRIGKHLHDQHLALLGGLTPAELDALTLGLTALARVLTQTHGLTHAESRTSAAASVDALVSADGEGSIGPQGRRDTPRRSDAPIRAHAPRD